MNHFLIGQPRKVLDEAIEQVERVRKLANDDFKILQPSNLAEVLGNKPLVEPKDYNRCLVSELRTLITPNGSYICPYFRGMPDKRIGDVSSQSFQEMWKGEERSQTMAATNPAKDCRFHCIRHSSNLILEDMAEGDFVPEPIADFDWFI